MVVQYLIINNSKFTDGYRIATLAVGVRAGTSEWADSYGNSSQTLSGRSYG